MYGLVNLGDHVVIQKSNGPPNDYEVQPPRVMGLAVAMIANLDAEHAYVPLLIGDVVTVRTANGVEREAKVVLLPPNGTIILEPTSMKHGDGYGCDCPECWQRAVEGEETGASPPGDEFVCPACKHQWFADGWSGLTIYR